MGMIVVGVDHSEGAKAALRFALHEARLRGTAIRVVHAWRFADIGLGAVVGYYYPAHGSDINEQRDAVEAALDATLHEVIPEGCAVEIERRLAEGTPGSVLVEESRNAELLVVGSRGHGGFTGLLLGSVSQQCAQHSVCPVVIIPHAGEN